MVDFGAKSTSLSDAQGAGTQPLAPIQEQVVNTFPGQLISGIGEIFVKGLQQNAKAEAEKQKNSILAQYTDEISKINDGVATGQINAMKAATLTRAINNKYMAGYPQYIEDLDKTSKFFKGNTEIGQALEEEQEAQKLFQKDKEMASADGYTFFKGMSREDENRTVDTWKAGRRMQRMFEEDVKRSAELRAKAAEGRAQDKFNLEMHEHQMKERAQAGLTELAGKNLENFAGLGLTLANDKTMTFEQKQALLAQNMAMIQSGLNAVAGTNPQLAAPWTAMFKELNIVAEKIIDPKIASQNEAESLKAQFDAIITKGKIAAVMDRDVRNAVVSSSLFNHSPILSLQTLPGVKKLANILNGKEVPDILVEPKSTLDYVKASTDRLNDPKTSKEDKEKLKSELSTVNGAILKATGSSSSIDPKELKELTSYYASSQFGKLAKEGLLPPEELANAKRVLQIQYEPLVTEAVMNVLNTPLPAGDSNPTGKLKTLDLLDVKMEGSRVVFMPKPTLEGKELFKQVDRMKVLKKAEAGLNQLVQMGAHLNGTMEYGKVWEENKHLFMPGVFPDPASQSTGYGKRADGTEKGKGYFGELKSSDGKSFSTEISVGVNLGGKEMEIPTLVPGLTQQEIDYLVNGGKPTDAIVDKAVAHAKKRLKEGKSPFAGPNESNPVSKSANNQWWRE